MEEAEQNKVQNDLEEKLKECERQKAEYLSGWQRARADFLNYKKEEMERIGELIGYAKEEFLLKILPILDNFNQAEKTIPESEKANEHLKGLLQIKSQIMDFLSREGVKEMDTVGKKFDPNYHEIVAEEEKEGAESGIILEEIQKGYTIEGRVLRPVKVKVAK